MFSILYISCFAPYILYNITYVIIVCTYFYFQGLLLLPKEKALCDTEQMNGNTNVVFMSGVYFQTVFGTYGSVLSESFPNASYINKGLIAAFYTAGLLK